MSKLKLAFLLLVFAFFGLAVAIAIFVYDINSPLFGDEKKEITISPGTSVQQIAEKLQSNNLIRSATTFSWYVRLKSLSSKLQAGRYEIPPNLALVQIVELLRHGTFNVRLTFLEGWRREQYLEYALENLAVDDEIFSDEFMSLTKDLEGYLFPDTYVVSVSVAASNLVKILNDNFDAKYESTVSPLVEKSGLTKIQVVIVASILERETLGDEDEMQTIAGILIKRWKSGWRLDVDATVQYVLGYQETKGEWWKDRLTIEDLATDSPYNTYKNKGLPPAPISSPGLGSLLASANYDKNTPYWFYLHDREGRVHYAATLTEHNANRVKYLK